MAGPAVGPAGGSEGGSSLLASAAPAHFPSALPAARSPGMAFSAVVGDAKAKGYTEPDPRDDLNGTDVARKVGRAGRSRAACVVRRVPDRPSGCGPAPRRWPSWLASAG